MATRGRVQARRQLDRRLKSLRNNEALNRPPQGWVRAIRSALGMTAGQLGRRMGVSRQRAEALERAEKGGSLTLDSLERAARALGCTFVYALVPIKPLEKIVEERAMKVALRQIASTEHSMALEAQQVDEIDRKEQLKSLVVRLIDRTPTDLWEDED